MENTAHFLPVTVPLTVNRVLLADGLFHLAKRPQAPTVAWAGRWSTISMFAMSGLSRRPLVNIWIAVPS